jgi:hypothetical protein
MSSPADEQSPQAPSLHPALEPLAWLVGTWRGGGAGVYPTIEDFHFEQELIVSHDGRPFLHHATRSWIVDGRGERIRPAASEVGWWRPGATPRSVELMLAHHTGVVEVYLGEVAFSKVELSTEVVARTETAKEITGFRRLYGLLPEQEGGRDLGYVIEMAAVGQPLQPHLSAQLSRVR